MRGEERDVAHFEQSFQWCFLKESHRQTDGLQTGFVDTEVALRTAELLGSRGCDHWDKVQLESSHWCCDLGPGTNTHSSSRCFPSL